jgi:tartrate-resistant acid phosphatase type 5
MGVSMWLTLVLLLSGCNWFGPPEVDPVVKPFVETGTVRFIALGDGGEGNAAQYQNSEAIEEVCDSRGCAFALYLGDNFYDDGVDDVYDDQFLTKFEFPYANLDFPFYAVMGNHDYGGNGIGNEPEKAAYEIGYSDVSEKWNMPSRYYYFTREHVSFYGLDTNAILWSWEDEQADWLPLQRSMSHTSWNIAFGHHPYISNGKHGNAGTYEGIPDFPVVSGSEFKQFADAHLCGAMDLYLSGHDHTLQWLHPQCGTEFIVSGAAAKTTSLAGWGNETFFEYDSSAGFIWIEISDEQLHGVFYDQEGTVLFDHSITKD